MHRLVAYSLSLVFLLGFFWLDYRTSLYDAAIPYFGAVLFALFSPARIDVIVISLCCLLATLGGGFVSFESDQSFSESIQAIVVNRSMSIFALVCITYVGWQRRGISLKLQELNQRLEERVDLSEREASEFQLQLTKISSTLDQHTVERRKTEREFRETIASYQSLIESLPINVFQKNRNAQLIFGNARYFETLGTSKEDCLGKTDFDLFPKELAEKYHADDQKVMEQGEALELIEDHLMPDGKKIYVQVFKAPIRNSKNKIVGLQGMFWDVTDRFRAEQSQKEADARFRRLVNSNIIGIFTGTFDGKIVEANDEFLNLLGYSREDLEGGEMRWDELTPEEFRDIDQTMESEITREGYCRPMEKEYVHRSGRRIPVLVGAVRLDSNKNEAICSVVDITRQKQAEQALKIAKDAADEANRSKSLFLANMSHEIRTPLNAIIGLTDLVLKTSLSRQQAEYLKMVNESGEALLEVISDVLDFSKLQAGKVKLETVPFSLRDKIGELLRPLSIRAFEKSLKLVCDIAGDVPDQLVGDPVCLRQIVTNLISNAIKFTDKGEIVLTVTVSSKTNEKVELHVSVADTGTGIESDLQRKIFKEFEQADNTSTRKYGGTGLGLAICSHLVELLDGEIWVDSEPGSGSTFHFTSQWKAGEKQSRKSNSVPTNFNSTGVLVVDEHQRSLEVLEKILKRWDLNVRAFDSVAKALDCFQDAPKDFPIVILDEVTVKNHHEFNSGVIRELNGDARIICLRSSIENNEEQAATDENANYFLLKPVQESELFDFLAESLAGEGFVAPEIEETEPRLPPLKILLAEDNLVNQKLATAILTQRQHEVQIASDGAEAISLATSQAFDLILMDIQMPNVDGIEATQAIRKLEADSSERTVIIALTAHAGESDRVRCLQAGMDGYVTKPLRPFELAHEIKRLVKTGWTNGLAARQKPNANSSNSSEDRSQDNATTGTSGGVRIDWEEALNQTGDDPNLLKDLIGIFEVESPAIVQEIEKAVVNEDRVKISEKTHHLKGSFRVFACVDALDIAQRLEKLDESEAPRPLFDELKAEYDKVYAALIEYRNQG